MAQTLYLDCVGGVAGDMLLAALVDAGASLESIRAGLPPVDGVHLDVERVPRCGVEAALVTVTCPPQHAHRKLHDVRANPGLNAAESGCLRSPGGLTFTRRRRAPNTEGTF